MNPLSDPLQNALQKFFGFSDFRGPQREIMEYVLAGGNALVVMPTGSGKSLLYQIPALLAQGQTIVLSPLIALMKDQVDALQERGYPASFINSSLRRREREGRLREFVAGRTRLLYVTPERFRSPPFLQAMAQVKVDLLAVDEAHCATEWGHDFRPDYSRIFEIRKILNDPTTMAMTATATVEVQREIKRLIGIDDAKLFHTGIERPNLFLSVTDWIDEEEKWQRILALLEKLSGAGIVYGALIKDLHRLEDVLQRNRYSSFLYHGGLSAKERRWMQECFMSGSQTRVLATNAFGMGVDKSDIRYILHHQVPGSVEAYYQEVGRAGRDGLPSYCELTYLEQDLAIQSQFVEWANPDRKMLIQVARILEEWGKDIPHYEAEDLRVRVAGRKGHDGRVETCLQWLEVLGVLRGSFEGKDLEVLRGLDPAEIPNAFDPDKRQRDLKRLLKLVEFVRSPTCRRAWLNEYFGLSASGSCDACDNCVDREEWIRANLPTVVKEPTVAAVEEPREPRRGDFVEIDGRAVGTVLRVSEGRNDLRFEIELSPSMKVRRFSSRNHDVRVLRTDGETGEPQAATPGS